jgi:hypothetical protein
VQIVVEPKQELPFEIARGSEGGATKSGGGPRPVNACNRGLRVLQDKLRKRLAVASRLGPLLRVERTQRFHCLRSESDPQRTRGSIRLRARELDPLGHFLGFLGDQLPEAGRARKRNISCRACDGGLTLGGSGRWWRSLTRKENRARAGERARYPPM